MPGYRTQEFTDRFKKSYGSLPARMQARVDKTIALLLANPAHPGLNVHSIKDAKYYWEAYVTRGDRLIYRPEGDHVLFVDVVPHDHIDRYSSAPKRR